jgi:hypothetical protein
MKHVPHSPTPSRQPLPLSFCRALLVASLGLAASANAAPVPMNGTGSYTENFDTLPTTGTTNPWVNDSTLPAWYAEFEIPPTSYAIRAGDGTSNSLERSTHLALAKPQSGHSDPFSSGTPGRFAYGVLLQNTSSGTILINSIAFTGEQWRNGGNTTAHKLTCSYQKSTTPITTLDPGAAEPAGWTALPGGDFTGPVATATAAALDGNLPAYQAAVSTSPNIPVAAGEYIFLRWHDPNDAGNDHGLALDDLTISWAASTLPSLTVTAPLDIFSESAGPNASVGTVTIPAALASDLLVSLVSSDPTEATVPASVTIPAGQTSANFNISAVNDLLADGSQSVIISATADGYLAGQKSLSVEDDFDAPISVSVVPSSFFENAGPEAATGTIIIAENTLVDLTVNLNSTDITEATVPASVIIPAGKNTVDFKVAAQDDADVDGDRTVTIQASATGYTGGSIQIQVLDFGDTVPPATLSPGAIAFVGYNADGNDDFAFVALSPIAETDLILFTDNEWNGEQVGSGGQFNTGEGFITWTPPAGGVAPGTIVTLNSLSTSGRSANLGSITAVSGSMNFGGSDETLYAYQGSLQTATGVIAVIATHTADSTAGTGLTPSHIVYLPDDVDIAAYTGSRSNQPAFADYLAAIGDTANNWITQDGSGDQSNDGTAPDVPFSTTPFTLGTGDSFASWIAGYPAVGGLNGPNDDFDNDGLDNMVENILGSDPSVANAGLNTVSGTATSVTFRHTRADSPATDLTATYEWSADLATWYPSGPGGGITVTIGAPVVINNGSPNDIVEVTATVTNGSTTKLFVRLKVGQ